MEATPEPVAEASEVTSDASLGELIARARRGDTSVVAQIREHLRSNPDVWQRLGSVALSAQAAWIRLIAGPDEVRKECVIRQLNALKEELAGDASSPIESLLIERIATTWLQLAYCDARAAQHEEKDLRWAEFELKRLNSASDRHLKSIVALSTVRRLMPRTIDVESVQPVQKDGLPANRSEAGCDVTENESVPAVKIPRNGHSNGHAHRLSHFFAVTEATGEG